MCETSISLFLPWPLFPALRRVRTAVGLYRDAAGSACVECVLGEEAVALGEAEFGVLRLGAGEPFPVERTVLWLGVQNLAFSLVCDMHENLLLAEGTLRNLARHCMEELRLLGPGSEVTHHSHHQYTCSCFIIIIIINILSCLHHSTYHHPHFLQQLLSYLLAGLRNLQYNTQHSPHE